MIVPADQELSEAAAEVEVAEAAKVFVVGCPPDEVTMVANEEEVDDPL